MNKIILIASSFLSLVLISVACERVATVSKAETDKVYAKNFSLSSLEGNTKVELNDFKDKPVVLNFWASWCAPCREEMPFLQKTWKEYENKGVVFIGIDVLDDEKNAKEFLSLIGVTYINLKDRSGEISNAYGVVGLPATIFINRQGEIIRKNYGPFLGEKGEKSFIATLEEIVK